MKVNYPLIDQVKAQFTLTIELVSITKRAQMLLLAGNILWKIWIPPLPYKVSKEIIFVSFFIFHVLNVFANADSPSI